MGGASKVMEEEVTKIIAEEHRGEVDGIFFRTERNRIELWLKFSGFSASLQPALTSSPLYKNPYVHLGRVFVGSVIHW